MKDSTDVVSVSTIDDIRFYHATPNSIIQFGSESAMKTKKYVGAGKITTVFPLEYNDSLKESFRCEGVYCGNHLFRESGVTFVKVDAEGTIILGENDSVRNVKRLHTIDTYSVCMDIDSTALDTARLTQIIDERFEWYIAGSQYPMFECGISTTYQNLAPIGSTKYAFCNMTERMAAFYVKEEREDSSEEDYILNENANDSNIIHYRIVASNGSIIISYDIDEDATICAILASHMGMTYRHKELHQQKGLGYSMSIDTNGLRSGTYILYINVNGKIYSEKIYL